MQYIITFSQSHVIQCGVCARKDNPLNSLKKPQVPLYKGMAAVATRETMAPEHNSQNNGVVVIYGNPHF